MTGRQWIGLAIVAVAIAAAVLVPSRLGEEDGGRDRDFFAHRTPERVTPHQRIVSAGYRPPRRTGENLAKGEGEAGSAASIVDGWMHSPGHRANILRRGFEEIGVAIVEGDGTSIYVTTFGARF
ncbi:MAG TPA: CAP domain-containing protein [Solirubrobacteraceae bacterium]|nr:CAP domain-containing protein [Solirubrobacteraceae bacterium]